MVKLIALEVLKPIKNYPNSFRGKIVKALKILSAIRALSKESNSQLTEFEVVVGFGDKLGVKL